MGHLEEVGQDEYKLSSFTKSLSLDVIGDGYLALQGRLPWMHPSIYPVEETLFPGIDEAPDAPLVVDVAGGLGHDINEFKKNYPNHPGEATAGDILMMTQLSALERTEDNWYQLIEGSGLNLKIVKFWKCGVSNVENLIECELA
ncbi:hypothetical protein IL306_014389 [Fusarium sp. DS 682]|nr:hypothetical protein IL306_014389 [Fusarium sp. DS 682]